MEKTDILMISILAGIVASSYQEYMVLTFFVGIAILFDIATGILKAKINCSINSNKGFKGFWRKLSLLAGLVFGFFLDILENYLIVKESNNFSINIPFSLPIGIIVGVYIILNESISVYENLYECGVKLPAFLIKSLKTAQKNVGDGDSLE